MRARSRDSFMRLLVALMVAVLNVPGLLIYLLLRPRETLAEAYERSLEEEALLQEIEEKPVCPTCGIRTQDTWQVCPSCHTKVEKTVYQLQSDAGIIMEYLPSLCDQSDKPGGK